MILSSARYARFLNSDIGRRFFPSVGNRSHAKRVKDDDDTSLVYPWAWAIRLSSSTAFTHRVNDVPLFFWKRKAAEKSRCTGSRSLMVFCCCGKNHAEIE